MGFRIFTHPTYSLNWLEAQKMVGFLGLCIIWENKMNADDGKLSKNISVTKTKQFDDWCSEPEPRP